MVLGLRHARLVLRGMIEANGAELWAISVSNPLQPLACSHGRWATFFVEVSSRIRRGFGEAIVPVCRDFDGALGKPFLPAGKVAFSSGVLLSGALAGCKLVVHLRPTTGLPQADHRPLRLGQLLPKYEPAHLQKLVRIHAVVLRE